MSKAKSTEATLVTVRVTFTMPVEVPASWTHEQVRFNLEDNHCMLTGCTGAALDRAIKEHERDHTCAGCALGSEVEVIG